LRGTEGIDSLVVANNDGLVSSPEFRGADARPGHTVRLTVNAALQEIAEQALVDAMGRTGAGGGDVVVLDPADGAVLALTGYRSGAPSPGSPPLMDAYEPGSVLKPFVVARLLELGRTTPTELIDTENGRMEEPGRKAPLTDEHKAPFMTVTGILRWSSNIGIAKLVRRLSDREQYEGLRDFGFGTLAAVPHPAEAPGLLPRPPYRPLSRTQLGIGYGLQVTPLQLAVAYAAIANGGDLVQPLLVRALLDPQGRTVQASSRTVIRRVMSPGTARAIRGMLESVVDSGTSRAAALASFTVAGKSGTARRAERGGYVRGGYNSTFVGLFPAEDPQVVVVARLIDPRASIFGGTVAGGLVNDLLQRALASRDAGLDRGRLAAFAKAPAPRVPGPGQPAVALGGDMPSPPAGPSPVPPFVPRPAAARIVVQLPLQPVPAGPPAPVPGDVLAVVPDVAGLDPRQAIRVLMQGGFAVRVERGALVRTRPEAGTVQSPGALITLEVPP
jgi:cell division protein FtsI (penicillin-binding protein 3)